MAACIVIVTVDAPAEALPGLVEHARMGIRSFGGCEGFVGGDLHVARDGTRLVQRTEWASDEAYEACRDDPRWDEAPTTAPFLALVRDGTATMDVRRYERLERSG